MGRGGKGWRRASASSYEVTFTYKGVRCRERVALQPSPTNDKRVERHRAAVLDAIYHGTFDYGHTFPGSPRAIQFAGGGRPATTVAAYLDGWLTRVRPLLKASTWRDYRHAVDNHLIPAFGAYALADLKRPVIRDWCAGLTAGNKRIANLLSCLRTALQEAVSDDLIEVNPLWGWSYRRREPPRQDRVDPFTAEEQRAILAAAASAERNLFQFAFWTGLRTSELIGLEWDDIDWRRGVVMVQRAVTQASRSPEQTKTRAGTREVRLLPPAAAALQAQKALSALHPSGRVFLGPDGAPWRHDGAIRKAWRRVLRRAKVRYRNPYQTRHTWASMMLSAGEPPRWVAEQMGHANLQMVLRVYARWMPEANPDAGLAAVRLFATR